MSFLLDTNVVSELRVRRRSSEPAFAWREANLGAAKAISVMTILELEFGVRRAEMQNLPHAAALRAWLEGDVMSAFHDAILPIDLKIARICARLQTIRTFSEADGLIAATALAYGLTVVTRDVEGFADSGVAILNPWRD